MDWRARVKCKTRCQVPRTKCPQMNAEALPNLLLTAPSNSAVTAPSSLSDAQCPTVDVAEGRGAASAEGAAGAEGGGGSESHELSEPAFKIIGSRQHRSATSWLLRGYFAATSRLLRGYFVATSWLLRGYFAATSWLLRGYFVATLFALE